MQQRVKQSESLFNLFNPFVAYLSLQCTYGQNFDFKIRRDEQIITCERRVYESVDDNSLSYALSQKPTKKTTHATKG